MKEEIYYTTGEVAEILGCTKQWISQLARDGKIESYRLQGTGWHRFSKSAVEKYIRDNRIPAEIGTKGE